MRMGSKSKKNVIYLIYSILWSNVLNIEYIFANVLFNGLFPSPNTFNKYSMHV